MKRLTEKNLVKACFAEWDVLDPQDNKKIAYEVKGSKVEDVFLLAKIQGLKRVAQHSRIAGKKYDGYSDFVAKDVVKSLKATIANSLQKFNQAVGSKAEKLALSLESSDEQLKKALSLVTTRNAVKSQASISPAKFKDAFYELKWAIENISVLREVNKLRSGFYAGVK